MRRLACTLFVLLSLTACTDATRAADPVNDPALPKLTRLWSLPTYKTIGYSSLQGDLYLSGNKLRAVNVATHLLAFEIPEEVSVARTSFASVGPNLLAVLRANTQTAMLLFTRTGQVLNKIEFPGSVGVALGNEGPVVVGNAVYLGFGNTVYKYAADGLGTPGVQPLWAKHYDANSIDGLLVQDQDHLYVTVRDTASRLLLLDGTGTERWSRQLAPEGQTAALGAAMGLYKDTIIVQAGTAGLQAYRQADGSKAWASFPSIDVCPSGASPLAFRMAIGQDRVFLGHFGGHCVLSFRADTGAPAWIFDAPNRVTFDTEPLYLNGVVYATNGRLWALDAETGRALAAGPDDLQDNTGAPLSYDAPRNQIVTWGGTGVFAYTPLR
jgi:outer membrane protein assembly factor BamB